MVGAAGREERDLRELAMHFSDPSLEVVEEESTFWLNSSDFTALVDPEDVQRRGRVLVARASGALHVEFGRFAPPRVAAALMVDDAGAKKHFIQGRACHSGKCEKSVAR
jgi:hypothetical protein